MRPIPFLAVACLLLLAGSGLAQQRPAQDPPDAVTAPTPEDLYELAVNEFQAGRDAAARDTLLRAIEKRPDYPDALNLLGVLCDRSELFLEAERYFKQALELSPSLTSASFNLGLSYAHQGRFELALQWFERTVEIDPSRLDAVLQSGVASLELRRFSAAKDYLERYTAQQPESSWGQLALGEAYMALSEPLKAIERFQAAASREGPARADALGQLGQAYYNAGQFEEAEQAIDRSLTIEPENGTALLGKGWLRLDAGQWPQARALFGRVSREHPSHWEARLLSAMAGSRAGDVQVALGELQELVSARPDYAEAYYQLAMAYQKLNRTDEAQRALDRFREIQASNSAR